MKTLTILLLGVVLIIAGCLKTDEFPEGNISDNQLKSADTRTKNFPLQDLYPDLVYATPIICDGEIVDYLVEDNPGSEISAQVTAHYIDGKMVWAELHCKGTLTSEATGETFKIVDQTRATFDENSLPTSNIYHVHALGDKGTHVINFFEVDFNDQTLVLIKSICPGNDK